MPSNRQRKLDSVVAQLQLQYGPTAIRKAAPAAKTVARLATSFTELDRALDGGLPRGRITEIVGAATSGKATLAAKALASAQADRHAVVAWLDLPRTSDPDYLHRCGIDLSRLLVVRPRDGADALAITLHLVEGGAVAAVVFDATTQRGEAGAADPATIAGSLERLAALVTQTQIAVIFLTEPRGASRSPALPTGPRGLSAATVRLALRHERWITRGDDLRGYEARVEIVKNRLGESGGEVPLRIVFNGTVRGAGL